MEALAIEMYKVSKREFGRVGRVFWIGESRESVVWVGSEIEERIWRVACWIKKLHSESKGSWLKPNQVFG